MKYKITLLAVITILFFTHLAEAQQSIARQWNEEVLHAIREDFARPTVHARNLWHTSIAMYDAWAVFDSVAQTYLLGKTVDGYTCNFDGIPEPVDVTAAREEAMSFAVYRILQHRFVAAPGANEIFADIDALMVSLGYNINNTSTDYSNGDPAALGNYIAECIIDFGFQDGANEQFGYLNLFYEPVNPPLVMKLPGNPDILDYNRWQPLTLDVFIDQSGNPIPFNTPEFLSPEWGQVTPFSMKTEDLTSYMRDGFEYKVYHDPGPPPMLDTTDTGDPSIDYKWGFSLVSVWSAHLDPADTTMWDISPASIGNIQSYPASVTEYPNFYDIINGGDSSPGHPVNPITGQPYEPQIVPRADYGRVLAEFWADGPDSETPPGHWYVILNYVNDQPELVKKFRGQGEVLDDLEWDVKSYFTLGGTMHDVAISSWGIKGWYDYIRPVSAIRGMADLGQSTDPNLPSYHPAGIPLIPGYIELVQPGEFLAGPNNEHVGKIKIYAWRGPDFIDDPVEDVAGVDWILAENWWPYQRPSFVTPPFAGYISGHSTYSRAAAEVLTALTGDPFFPGGMGEFHAPVNEFLVFENGPSVDLTLQWATYRDASDQCSLSRIWGGIHPPADDIPGRFIGMEIGVEAFDYAETYFYKDEDEDGYYNYVDCDDQNENINPGMAEICDGIDNNCDGNVDEGFQYATFYIDADGDGFGSPADSIESCPDDLPAGYADNKLDCDDDNDLVNPGMMELCDGIDNNCDGMADEGLTIQTYYFDSDNDTYGDAAITLDTCLTTPPAGFVTNALDCNDADSLLNPGMAEICDGIDNDCNGLADDGLQLFTYYPDLDEDGFGDANAPIDTCEANTPAGYLIDGTDCDDTNPMINPEAMEVFDSLDNDCDGEVDEGVNSTYELSDKPRKLFPNPATETLFIEYEHTGELVARLFRTDGQLVRSQNLLFVANRTGVDLADLAPGVYWIMLSEKDGRRHFIEKVVKM